MAVVEAFKQCFEPIGVLGRASSSAMAPRHRLGRLRRSIGWFGLYIVDAAGRTAHVWHDSEPAARRWSSPDRRPVCVLSACFVAQVPQRPSLSVHCHTSLHRHDVAAVDE